MILEGNGKKVHLRFELIRCTQKPTGDRSFSPIGSYGFGHGEGGFGPSSVSVENSMGFFETEKDAQEKADKYKWMSINGRRSIFRIYPHATYLEGEPPEYLKNARPN